MAKRKYTKRSEYWNKFDPQDHPSRPRENEPTPELLGEPFYTSDASYGEVSKARRQRSTRIKTNTIAS